MMCTVSTGLECAGRAHDPGKATSARKSITHSLGLSSYLIRRNAKKQPIES